MIKTEIELQFSKERKGSWGEEQPVVVLLEVPDSVFSALRGPDNLDEGPAKALGSTIIRKYLHGYNYGFQSTLAESLGVGGASTHYVTVPNNWDSYWRSFYKELSEMTNHYASHMHQAFFDLTQMMNNAWNRHLIDEKVVKMDAAATFHLSNFWANVNSYLIESSGDNIVKINRILQNTQLMMKNLILFIAENSELTKGHEFFQMTHHDPFDRVYG